jgi:hypothetical protein
MPRFDEGYAGLARVRGRVSGADGQGIVVGVRRERDQVAAAMSEAIRRGDVRGVVAALSLLGVQPPAQNTPRG